MMKKNQNNIENVYPKKGVQKIQSMALVLIWFLFLLRFALRSRDAKVKDN